MDLQNSVVTKQRHVLITKESVGTMKETLDPGPETHCRITFFAFQQLVQKFLQCFTLDQIIRGESNNALYVIIQPRCNVAE